MGPEHEGLLLRQFLELRAKRLVVMKVETLTYGWREKGLPFRASNSECIQMAEWSVLRWWNVGHANGC